MARRRIPLVSEEYYHIYNRGNSKQIIFHDDLDRDRFTKLLYLCNSRVRIDFREDIVRKKIDAFDFDRGDQVVSIASWVIMPNHFHIYLKSCGPLAFAGREEDVKMSNISFYIEKLCMAYAKYFNARHGRTGALFESKFKAIHVNIDNYAKYLFSYIHLNPVKLLQSDWKEKGIRNKKTALIFLQQYRWSSFLDFLGTKRDFSKIIDRKAFPDYFPTSSKFTSEILEWIDLKATD